MWSLVYLSVLACLSGSTLGFNPHDNLHHALGKRDSHPLKETDWADALRSPSGNEPKRFIVEFADGVDADSAVAALSTLGTVRKVFDSPLFRGASLDFHDAKTKDEGVMFLQSIEHVAQAWPSRKVILSPMVPKQSFSQDATAQDYDIHYMTGVDKLHEQGIFGKGVTVALIDSGIDYTHPALGGAYGPGHKIAGGYDLVGDGEWPENNASKIPDDDPQDNLGHGTHVAGILAGKNDTGFIGVAPEATILIYKVFGKIDATDEETLIDAFLMAYKANVDIISCSVGGTGGWTENAWATIASRIVDEGVVVTISVGNDGDTGAYSTNAGSVYDPVIAVASVEASTVASPAFVATFTLNGTSNSTRVGYQAPSPWQFPEVTDWPIVPFTLNTSVEDDACGNSTDPPKIDLSDKIVLVRRGGCLYADKQNYLAGLGAKYVLFYNNDRPFVQPQTDNTDVPIAMLTAEAGADIIATVQAGGNVTADFSVDPGTHLVGLPWPYGGLPNSFSSMGPSNELYLKPDIAAPGGNILSTFPGGWKVLDGTSMACPYVAGIAALYIGKFGGRATHGPGFARDLAMRIIASGEPTPWDDGSGNLTDYGVPASAAQVGTGLVDATKVLQATTALSYTKFALNDTAYFTGTQHFVIRNTGNDAVTYNFTVEDFGGLDTQQTNPAAWGAPRIAWYDEMMLTPQKYVPSVNFLNGGTVTLQPGENKTVDVTFEAPEGLDAEKLPIYSGAVVVRGSNDETLRVPYLGLAADLRSVATNNMWQRPIGYPTLSTGPPENSTSIADKPSFSFNPDVGSQDFPHFYQRLNIATRELRWDIFMPGWTEFNWVYPPVVGANGYVGSATSWESAVWRGIFNPATNDSSDLLALPLTELPRDIQGKLGISLWWFGRLANGSMISPGKYQMRIAALHPFGDPKSAQDWDVFETPEVEVLPLQ